MGIDKSSDDGRRPELFIPWNGMRSHENLRNVLAAVTGKSFYVRHSPTGTGKKIKVRMLVHDNSKQHWRLRNEKEGNLFSGHKAYMPTWMYWCCLVYPEIIHYPVK
jgi:hypothetical protein